VLETTQEDEKVSNRFQRSWNVARTAVETTSAHLYVCRLVGLSEIYVNKPRPQSVSLVTTTTHLQVLYKHDKTVWVGEGVTSLAW